MLLQSSKSMFLMTEFNLNQHSFYKVEISVADTLYCLYDVRMLALWGIQLGVRGPDETTESSQPNGLDRQINQRMRITTVDLAGY